jgi:hypothetical protein
MDIKIKPQDKLFAIYCEEVLQECNNSFSCLFDKEKQVEEPCLLTFGQGKNLLEQKCPLFLFREAIEKNYLLSDLYFSFAESISAHIMRNRKVLTLREANDKLMGFVTASLFGLSVLWASLCASNKGEGQMLPISQELVVKLISEERFKEEFYRKINEDFKKKHLTLYSDILERFEMFNLEKEIQEMVLFLLELFQRGIEENQKPIELDRNGSRELISEIEKFLKWRS